MYHIGCAWGPPVTAGRLTLSSEAPCPNLPPRRRPAANRTPMGRDLFSPTLASVEDGHSLQPRACRRSNAQAGGCLVWQHDTQPRTSLELQSLLALAMQCTHAGTDPHHAMQSPSAAGGAGKAPVRGPRGTQAAAGVRRRSRWPHSCHPTQTPGGCRCPARPRPIPAPPLPRSDHMHTRRLEHPVSYIVYQIYEEGVQTCATECEPGRTRNWNARERVT